jgi:hypothetical protein
MGMPRKGSRKIVIDGKLYYWRLPAKKQFHDYDEMPPYRNSATLTIQSGSDNPGRVAQTLVAWIEGEAFTPEAAEIMIRKALVTGWNPDERGSAFKFEGNHVEDLPTKNNIIKSIMDL